MSKKNRAIRFLVRVFFFGIVFVPMIFLGYLICDVFFEKNNLLHGIVFVLWPFLTLILLSKICIRDRVFIKIRMVTFSIVELLLIALLIKFG
jgi:hypothetical protein